jgi:hypothetical protein
MGGVSIAALLLLAASDVAAVDGLVELAVELRAGEKTAEPNLWRIAVGDRATILWRTEQRVELHLHGYDITVIVGPGQPGEMSFHATIAGRFPVEVHGSGGHAVVFYVEVHPQ